MGNRSRTNICPDANRRAEETRFYNELVPGQTGKNAFDIKGAIEVPLGPTAIMVGGDFRQYRYDHHANFGFIPCALANAASCTTVVGNDFNYRSGTEQ